LLALLAAMKLEIGPLKRQMKIQKESQTNGCLVYEGKYQGQPALLVQMGVGGHRAEAATKYVLASYQVQAIITFGFAGGLVPGLKAGELIICRHLFHGRSPALESAAPLVELARRITGSAEASLVTVSRPACKRHEKEALAQTYSAQAVDMESYWVAAAAACHGIPCLVVRVISDPLDCDLPNLEGISSASGEWNRKRAFLYFAGHPLETLRLSRLYFSHRRAKQNLVCFVNGFVSVFQNQVEKIEDKH
jgi:nucleoside phosphorylase